MDCLITRRDANAVCTYPVGVLYCGQRAIVALPAALHGPSAFRCLEHSDDWEPITIVGSWPPESVPDLTIEESLVRRLEAACDLAEERIEALRGRIAADDSHVADLISRVDQLASVNDTLERLLGLRG